MAGSCGYHNRVERCVCLPTVIAVTKASRNIVVTEPLKPCFRLFLQRLDDLYGIDGFHKARQYRRLVPRAGTHFQHDVICVHLHKIGHQRNDVGLRYGLAVTDRQRAVLVGMRLKASGYEFMTPHRHHRVHDALIEFPSAGRKTGAPDIPLDGLDHRLSPAGMYCLIRTQIGV